MEVVFFLNFKGEYFLDPRRTSRRRNQRRRLVQTVRIGSRGHIKKIPQLLFAFKCWRHVSANLCGQNYTITSLLRTDQEPSSSHGFDAPLNTLSVTRILVNTQRHSLVLLQCVSGNITSDRGFTSKLFHREHLMKTGSFHIEFWVLPRSPPVFRSQIWIITPTPNGGDTIYRK